jgi:DNA repair protein RadC
MASSDRPDTHFIREIAIRYVGRAKRAASPMRSPLEAVAFMKRVVTDDAREHFVALYLDGRHRPVGHQVVSVGTATASLVHPREVFQPAVLSGACAVIVGHNHPSGDPSPSAEDRDVTRRLARAGELLGIRLLDSLVWTRSGRFVSLQESEPALFGPAPR